MQKIHLQLLLEIKPALMLHFFNLYLFFSLNLEKATQIVITVTWKSTLKLKHIELWELNLNLV